MNLHKNSITIRLSDDDLWQRKGHSVQHPMTPEREALYARVKARWEAAKAEWDAAQEEAVVLDFAWWGRVEDDPSFRELEPESTWVYDETEDEYRGRIAADKAAGKWPERPWYAMDFLDDIVAGTQSEETP